jgi:hypothetical protein
VSLEERVLQCVRYPLDIGDVASLKSLIDVKAILRLLEFGTRRKEARYEPALAIDLVLAQFYSPFGCRKARHQQSAFPGQSAFVWRRCCAS